MIDGDTKIVTEFKRNEEGKLLKVTYLFNIHVFIFGVQISTCDQLPTSLMSVASKSNNRLVLSNFFLYSLSKLILNNSSSSS